ncbi:hypothetical protein XO10_03360 [Marinitoga sp. 1135]|uniref:Tetratricopeptide repeat protein n=2 Tax=Marinitoga TaxID=160798 RepID=H2J639_MARPK|nr:MULTISPECIES: hypothetical protein [Marinitoga]AEX85100.1 hypothetical protein Marpi_0662 [Marinitoga piezophila KA3]NUU95313.1 hypothetical protein [Marinitoga sp. 1135]NUU97247.1 hypothetical protein [Marinitoga sp. 1138]
MKNKFIVLVFLIVLTIFAYSQNLTESEKMARKLFSESLQAFFSGNRYEARLKLSEAMTNEIYLNDVPYFWYYAAKLDLLLGQIDKAQEDLNNILFFAPSNSETISLNKFISSLKTFGVAEHPELKVKELFKVKNIINSNEKFYIINDFEIINEYIYLLDVQNKLIYYTNANNTVEGWIKLNEIISDDFEAINIYYDDRTDYFYISGNTGLYLMKNFSKSNKYVFTKISSLKNLLLFGIDKVGRFWVFSNEKNSVLELDYTGKVIEEFKMSHDEFITSGSLFDGEIKLLDIKNKKLLYFSIFEKKIVKQYILKNKHLPYSIASLPFNITLISFMNDKTYLFEDGKLKEFYKFPYLLKYKNGVITKFDYTKFQASLDMVDFESETLPFYIFIYSIAFNTEKMKIDLKINTVYPGNNFIEFISKKIYITDSEGRYAFNYNKSLEKPNFYYFDNTEHLFLEMLPKIKNDSVVILNDEENSDINKYVNITSIIPFIFTNTSLYIVKNQYITEQTQNLVKLTGGAIIPKEDFGLFEKYIKDSKKIIQKINYKIFPPIAPGIRPVRIFLHIGNKVITDTMYYYSEGVGIAE